MSIVVCAQCRQRFNRGETTRSLCGVCAPMVDAGHFATVPRSVAVRCHGCGGPRDTRANAYCAWCAEHGVREMTMV